MKYSKEKLYLLTYNYNLLLDTQSLIEDILDRIDDPNNDDDIWDAIDSGLIYYDDQWTILKQFCNPTEVNWDYAIQEFTDMIFSLSSELMEEKYE